jgi:chromosome segregation ATPase
MKNALIILTAAAVGCGAIVVLFRHAKLTDQLETARVEAVSFSNRVEETRQRLEESEKVAALLQTHLTQREETLAAASNELATATAALGRAQSDLAAAQASLRERAAEVAGLQLQRDDLTQELDDLTAALEKLDTEIADTRRQLASAEGDRDFLLQQLKQLEAEKAGLQAQWNSLAALRDQYRKLREQAAVSQRLEWRRKGIAALESRRGAERLLQGIPLAAATPDSRLEVEVEQRGPARAVPPSHAPPK